jgi:hypothetical protein
MAVLLVHTKSEAEAAGTVLAISYASRVQDTSDINLSVISVAYKCVTSPPLPCQLN